MSKRIDTCCMNCLNAEHCGTIAKYSKEGIQEFKARMYEDASGCKDYIERTKDDM
jgi:hypothetical protein